MEAYGDSDDEEDNETEEVQVTNGSDALEEAEEVTNETGNYPTSSGLEPRIPTSESTDETHDSFKDDGECNKCLPLEDPEENKLILSPGLYSIFKFIKSMKEWYLGFNSELEREIERLGLGDSKPFIRQSILSFFETQKVKVKKE